MRESERPPIPEERREGRTLEGEERERFAADLREYIDGLEAASADPDLDEETRDELRRQLDEFKDSSEAIEEGREIKEY
ncbi:hypothetical protein AMJ57_00305 [Parcubacteria bacterium SG8_24]|nr:MAG: hypothetical protein AMJ57_00305 [Parcubacteria bacterium SG8_24]